MSSIIQHLKLLRSQGFTEDFRFLDGRMQGIRSGKFYKPEGLEVNLVKEIRHPAEDTFFLLYAISAKDGVLGTLVLSFQHPLFDEVSEFIETIQEQHMEMV